MKSRGGKLSVDSGRLATGGADMRSKLAAAVLVLSPLDEWGASIGSA